MSRTILSPQRLKETRKQHIGHIIIFCEGRTEYNYMQYFARIINKKDKFTDIKVQLEVVGGNAQTVLNYANDFLEQKDNNRQYSLYNKCLVFDCDDPKEIQQVIVSASKNINEYSLLISNFIFETWLLFHYENVIENLTKSKTYRHLEGILGLNAYEYSKKKDSVGIIRKIVSTGNIINAIDYAKKLDIKYKNEGKNIFTSIKDMSPYSNVYELIEQFMVAITEN